ncbi:MAG: hypothetical protein ACLFVD_01710 [Dehalococcoidia bacterium]
METIYPSYKQGEESLIENEDLYGTTLVNKVYGQIQLDTWSLIFFIVHDSK